MLDESSARSQINAALSNEEGRVIKRGNRLIMNVPSKHFDCHIAVWNYVRRRIFSYRITVDGTYLGGG